MALRDILLRFFDREIDRFKRLSGWFLQLRDQNIQHSIIAGWDGSDMRMVGVTRTNAMIVNDSPARGSFRHSSTSANEVYRLPDIEANWVTIYPPSGNNGGVYVAVGVTPTMANSMFLVKNQYHDFPVNNLSDVQLLFSASGDSVHIVYG